MFYLPVFYTQWMAAINHKIKITQHIMVGHFNWVEDATVKLRIKQAKEVVQKALKPGQVIGWTDDENVGVAYGYPDAKVLLLREGFNKKTLTVMEFSILGGVYPISITFFGEKKCFFHKKYKDDQNGLIHQEKWRL